MTFVKSLYNYLAHLWWYQSWWHFSCLYHRIHIFFSDVTNNNRSIFNISETLNQVTEIGINKHLAVLLKEGWWTSFKKHAHILCSTFTAVAATDLLKIFGLPHKRCQFIYRWTLPMEIFCIFATQIQVNGLQFVF